MEYMMLTKLLYKLIKTFNLKNIIVSITSFNLVNHHLYTDLIYFNVYKLSLI